MEREELFLPLPGKGEAGALMASITTQTGTLGGGPCTPHSPRWAHPKPACAAEQPPGQHRAAGTLPGDLDAKAMTRGSPRESRGVECEESWAWLGARHSRGHGMDLQTWVPFWGYTDASPEPG